MKLDLQYTPHVNELDSQKDKALQAFDTLLSKSGPGNDFLGWIDLPVNYDREEYARIKKAAKKIREDSEVLLVIGIGGSYLGARAVIEAFSNSYKKQKPEIIFAGNQLSALESCELIEYLQDKKFSINVISKSGTTTEPAIAFRIFKNLLEEKLGKEEAKSRIYVTTDKARGALKNLADREGYEEFVVPDDIGGRFTVLTAVGLLPIAVSGVDIDSLMKGAAEAREEYLQKDFDKNPALQYAAIRKALYDDGNALEIMVTYEPKLSYFQEWWKQLYGESEGKDEKGLFPASVKNTTDLHSLGQWIQQGPKNHFETVLWVKESANDVEIPFDEENADNLNYLAGKGLHEVNYNAMKGTLSAHVDGQVPNIVITMDKLDPEELGRLIYFYELAVGVSGYMLGVNPFDQPGVEFYKSNMYKLLGKPGY